MAEVNPAVFDKRIGEIALELNLITPEAQNRMIEVQARAIALVQHGQTPPAIAVLDNDAQWAQLSQAAGITPEAFAQAHQLASSPATITVPGVPPAGAVLSSISGGISADVKDALLAAQASEKALQLLDAAKQPGESFDDAKFDALLKQIELDSIHLGRAGEKAIVRNAQQTLKSAQKFNALEHHVDCGKMSAEDPELQQQRALLATTLPQQAIASYRASAIALGIYAAELAKAGNPEAEKVAYAADALVNMLANQRGITPPTEEELANFAQLRTAEHQKSEIGDAARTATELNQTTKSWVETTQRGNTGPQSGLGI